MKTRHIGLAAACLLLVQAPAFAESCIIEITGAKDVYKFVQVYDLATGKIVLTKAFKSGQSQSVTLKGDRIRVDWKFLGGIRYEAGASRICRGGNRIRV